jgi:hypothetical protein
MMNHMKTMKLVFLLMITLFSSNALTFSYANATEQIDFITFTQLDRVDQRRLVSTMQILAANLEEQQLGPVRRKNKYKTVQNILNFLIKDSYADNEEISPVEHVKLCIYAGWITYRVGGKCRHPNGISETNDGNLLNGLLKPHKLFLIKQKSDYKTYIDLVDGEGIDGCDPANGQDRMICNPKLFGYRLNGDGKTPFCSVGNKDSYNSSFGCIQAIKRYAKKVADKRTGAGEENNTVEAVKNEILDGVINAGVSTPQSDLDSLSNLLQLNYDICMCRGEEGYINKKYAEDMYDQRTCYAWLYQTKDIISRLKTKTCAKFEGFIYKKSKINETETLMSMMDWANKAYDIINQNILEESKQSQNFFDYENYGSSSNNDQRWIDNRPEMDPSNCPIEANESLALTISVSEKPKHSLATGLIVGLPGKNIDPNIEGWKFTPSNPSVVLLKHETNKNMRYAPCLEDEPYTITVTLNNLVGPEPKTIPKCEDPIIEDGLACTIKKGDDNRKTKIILADGTEETNTEEPGPQDENNAGDDEEYVMLSVSVPKEEGSEVSLDLKDAISITWSENVTRIKDKAHEAKFIEKDQEEREVTVEVLLSDNIKSECSINVSKRKEEKKEDDTPTYKIELAQEDIDDNNVKVTATVTKDGKEVDDLSTDKLTIDWTSLLKGKSSGDEDGDGVEDSEEDELKVLEEDSTKLIVEVEKKETEKVITAKLKKESEEVSKDSETISALEKSDDNEEEQTDDTIADGVLPNNTPQTRTPAKKRRVMKNKGGFFGNR